MYECAPLVYGRSGAFTNPDAAVGAAAVQLVAGTAEFVVYSW